jgi:DNA repair photolyase
MVDCFWGEFLLHITPLELSGNKCSHNCAYCFANIRKEARYSEIDSTLRFFASRGKKTLAGTLWERGYPLTLSNRTDPFAETNWRESLVFGKIFSDHPNGIFVQTKGGKREYIDSFITNTNGKKNIVWYITITTPIDDIAKIIEPGAPSPSERKKLAFDLRKMGYTVIIAFNPFVKGWTSAEQNAIEVDDFATHGINHFIYQNLHFNPADLKLFSEQRSKQFVRTGIDPGQYINRSRAKESQKYMQGAIIDAYKKGKNALAFGMPFKTDFFSEVQSALGGKMFPSNYHFYNWVLENKKEGDECSVDEYINALGLYMGDVIDIDFREMQTYVFRTARQVWRGNERAQSIRTYRELLKLIWEDGRIQASPQNFKFMKKRSDGAIIFTGAIAP